MHRFAILLFCASTALVWTAGAQALTVVSATSPAVGVTADSLAAIFGNSISTETLAASGTPWPTSLGDISVVYVTDSANRQQMCGILYISPTQMNIYIPSGVAAGPATISFPTTGLPPGVGTAALRTVAVNIQKVAPGLFSAAGTGSGVAAATAVRVTLPSEIQSPVPVFLCDQPVQCVAVPIPLGVDTPVYVSLHGTGIRGAQSVTVNIGGIVVPALYAGPQPQTPGLDQVNFPIPISLRGAGMVNVSVTTDGVMSNTVQLAIQ
jgi:uncharacterized protein (TIGR03437 family)